MHRSIDSHDGIAIAQIVVFVPFLIASIFLGCKHGLRRSGGWYFLILLSLARIIGSSFRLASISDADNTSLYVGWLILNNLGLTPLILALFGLLGRAVDSINRASGHVLVQARYRRLVDMVLLVALVLSIVGGTKSTYTITAAGTQVHYNKLVRVAIGIMIGGFVLLAAETLLVASQYRLVESGERRILLAVLVALPFVLVRLIYSGMKVFGNSTDSTWEYLGMSVIMEVIAVAVCLAVGLTLRSAPEPPKADRYDMVVSQQGEVAAPTGYAYNPPKRHTAWRP